MSKIFLRGLLAVACMWAAAVVGAGRGRASTGGATEMRFDGDGAYRDGIFLGKLASEGRQPSRVTIGRWSTEQDREMFTAGYRRGFSGGR